MTILPNCPICEELVNATFSGLPDGYQVVCPRCGEYVITGSALPELLAISNPRQKANISGWLNENQPFVISTYTLDNLSKIASSAESVGKVY